MIRGGRISVRRPLHTDKGPLVSDHVLPPDWERRSTNEHQSLGDQPCADCRDDRQVTDGCRSRTRPARILNHRDSAASLQALIGDVHRDPHLFL